MGLRPHPRTTKVGLQHGFPQTMVHDETPCCIIAYPSIPGYKTVYHGIRWRTMVYHGGFPWFSVVPWYTMVFHGRQWFSMVSLVYQNIPWHIMVYHSIPCHVVTPWYTMSYHGTPWYAILCHRIPLLYHGIAWYAMIDHSIHWYTLVYSFLPL